MTRLKELTYTTAPPEYDYGSTEVVEENMGTLTGHGLADGTVRLVECNETQRERYRSGGFLVSHNLENVKHYMEEPEVKT